MKKFLAVLGICLGLTATVYGYGAYHFSNHFPFRTELNGNDISGLTPTSVKEILLITSGDYELTLTGREEAQDTIKAGEIGLAPVFDATIDDLMAQDAAAGFKWPLSLVKERNYTVPAVVRYDEEKLSEKVDSLVFFDKERERAPENAVVEYYDGAFRIMPEDEGTTVDKAALMEHITEALMGLHPELDLETAGVYAAPSVRSDDPDLAAEAARNNRHINFTLTYRFGDEEEILNGEQFVDWVTFAGDEMTVDEKAAADFVAGLSYRHDTYGMKRELRAHNGKKIIIEGGDYGWWMDQESTTAELIEAIQAGESREMTPVYFGKAAQYGKKDYGDTYVEVDLDDQRVYLYVDGKVEVETDCVSGRAGAGAATPDGAYGIYYKQKDTVLRGEGYASPVSFWIPFNGNIGLHDATWRGKFGGDIYTYTGSHGCVNLPLSAARQIFELVEKGTPVLVHGGMDKEAAVEYCQEKGYRIGSLEPARPAPAPTKVTLDQVHAAEAAAQALQVQAAQAQQAASANPGDEAAAQAAANAQAQAQAAVTHANNLAVQYMQNP